MASHFKTTDDNNEGDAVTRRRTPAQGSTQGSAHVRAHHGDDESYHAPKANRHAAGTPHSVSAHYIPVVSAEPGDGEKKKRDARFVETDPYDLSGRRDGDPKKRIGRIVSAVLFILGIALILTAAGMWIYNQWQYHEQDVINEELATFADVSDDGVTAPQTPRETTPSAARSFWTARTPLPEWWMHRASSTVTTCSTAPCSSRSRT